MWPRSRDQDGHPKRELDLALGVLAERALERRQEHALVPGAHSHMIATPPENGSRVQDAADVPLP